LKFAWKLNGTRERLPVIGEVNHFSRLHPWPENQLGKKRRFFFFIEKRARVSEFLFEFLLECTGLFSALDRNQHYPAGRNGCHHIIDLPPEARCCSAENNCQSGLPDQF